MPEPRLPVLNADITLNVGRFVRVYVNGTLLEQATVNSFFFGAPIAAALNLEIRQKIGMAFWETVGPPWTALVSDQWNLTSIEVVDHFEVSGTPAIISPTEVDDTVGLVGGECMPPFAAIGYRRQTDFIGRRSRGSVRVAGVAEADHEQGVLTNDALGRAATLGGAFGADLNIEHPPGVNTIWSPYLFEPWVGVILGDRRGKQVVNWVVSNVVRTQGSRKFGIGV